MTKGLKRSLARGNPGGGPDARPPIERYTFTARALAMTVNGATGVGFGTAVLGDLPQGNILIHGAAGYMKFTGPGSASLVDTWNGDYGIGTTPAGDATLTAGDVDMIQSTAVGPAVAEASPRTRGTIGTTGVLVDNTDGSLEVNVSLLVDDVDISADGLAFTVDGELHLLISVLGDD